MKDFQNFFNELAQREGERRAKEIDTMMENALANYRIGRAIVWACKRKWMTLATLLSRLVKLEIREYRQLNDKSLKYEVILAGKVIGKTIIGEWFALHQE